MQDLTWVNRIVALELSLRPKVYSEEIVIEALVKFRHLFFWD